MTSRYSATLNNTTLASLDSSILVLDIREPKREIKDIVSQIAKRHGARWYERQYGMVSVTILFEIHKYSIADRREVCEKVKKWARNGGVLETNDRSGQYLQCVCTEFPAVSSAKNWTEPLSMTFTGYSIPFWQDKTATTKTLTGTSGSDTLSVDGSVDGALVEAEITAGASVTSVALTVNGKTLTLSNLSLENGQIVKIKYDTNGVQSIKVGSTSLLNKRTGADDLLAKCGSNTLAFESSAAVTVVFSIKGWWL